MRACLVMFDEDFRRVWPIHFQPLKNFNCYRLLSRSFPQILVADDVWPAYLTNSSEAGPHESLDSFYSDDGGYPVSAP